MDFINAIQPELLTIVIAAAVGAAGYGYQWAVQRLPPVAQKTINAVAQTVVQAIEQKYRVQSPGGALKKQEAMAAVAAICQEMKVPFHLSSANAAIESAVYAMNLYRAFGDPVPTTPAIDHLETHILPAVVKTPMPVIPDESSAAPETGHDALDVREKNR